MSRCAVLLLFTAAAATGMASPARAGTLDVPGQYPTIQVAINFAVDGDEIVVAPGTYFESLDLAGKDLHLRSSAGAATTIIDALGQLDSAIHCTSGETAATIIEGFTIRRGSAVGSAPENRGGAIYMNLTSPQVRDCIFEENMAGFGGAIYANGGAPAITGCMFIANSATNGGGAYMNNSNATFRECRFEANFSVNLGGGLQLADGTILVEDSTFEANDSLQSGAGLACTGGTNASVRRCLFVGNQTADLGGGISSSSNLVRVHDCVMAGNLGDDGGGGVDAVAIELRRCTIVGNASASGSRGAISGAPLVEGCIMWGNGAQPVSASASVSFSDVEGGHAGAGNIDADPLFVDAAGGNYRLQAGSPCVDAGNTLSLEEAYPVDFDGASRAVDDPDAPDVGNAFLNLVVDMGAFERQIECAASDPCPADVDGSGAIGFGDLLQILSGWGPCP